MADITVAVLGTGIMGSGMARNLMAAGAEVRAWNRSRDKAEPLSEAGAAVADSPAEAADGADFVLTMLADAAVTEEVVSENGVISGLADGGVWIQMATVGSDGAGRLGEISKDSGVPYVDAPVLGTRQPAEQGQLIVLASGPEEVREKCEPVFDAIGSKTLWLGGAGAGSRLKLVVNNWIAGLLGTLAESISLARATGVDPESFLETIEGGPIGLPYAQMKGRMMIDEDFPTSFSAELARKDVGLILEAANTEGVHLALAEAVAARFDQAIQAGHGDEDMAAIYEAIKPNAG
ncbi:MAG: NAD(P)-dependent oxidoreductase [Rubrobacteraceae bacterium]